MMAGTLATLNIRHDQGRLSHVHPRGPGNRWGEDRRPRGRRRAPAFPGPRHRRRRPRPGGDVDTLTHPSDLDAWHRWRDAQLPLGRRLHRWAGVLHDIAGPDSRAGQGVVTRGGPDPKVLVCLESLSPTSVKAVLHPLRDLHPEQVAVVAPVGVRDLLPPWTWTERTGLSLDLVPPLAAEAGLVLSTGHFHP